MKDLERRLERLEAAAYDCPDCGPTLERLLEVMAAIGDDDLEGGEDLSEVPDRCPSCRRKVLTIQVIDELVGEADDGEGGGGTG